ncbi:MAG: glucose dehydrogenase, partial [Sphingobacteriales bacterium]
MRLLKITLLSGLLLPLCAAHAQRGLPPKEKTRSVSITKYAQHLDFLPEMVKLLKAPDGWEVSIAASGLGKPRMMYMSPSGHLYVTRRDGGDVLMLTDRDGDRKFEEL